MAGQAGCDVRTSVTDWPDLPMVTSGDPYLMRQAEQDKLSRNPRWTPAMLAFERQQFGVLLLARHARSGARRVRARPLAGGASRSGAAGIGGGQAAPHVVRHEDARWVEGKLTAAGIEPLPLDQLASAGACDSGCVTGVVAHTFNRWQWAQADFEIDGADAAIVRSTAWRCAMAKARMREDRELRA